MIFGKLAQKNREKTPKAYEAYRSYLIEKMIEKKYSPKQEIAILRQRDSKPDEYKEYFEYVEQCKSMVNKELQK
jgi:hypothetical protein